MPTDLNTTNPQRIFRCPFCMGRLWNFDPPWIIPRGCALVVTYSVERGSPTVLVTIASEGLTRKTESVILATVSHDCPMQYPSTPHVE